MCIGTTTVPARDTGFARLLQVVLVTAVLVSIVHYVDDVVRYDDYAPQGQG